MYPGEKEHVAYQEYALDHAMGDAPGNKTGRIMNKAEWREYTRKGKNKMASGKDAPQKPQKRNPMMDVHAR